MHYQIKKYMRQSCSVGYKKGRKSLPRGMLLRRHGKSRENAWKDRRNQITEICAYSVLSVLHANFRTLSYLIFTMGFTFIFQMKEMNTSGWFAHGRNMHELWTQLQLCIPWPVRMIPFSTYAFEIHLGNTFYRAP